MTAQIFERVAQTPAAQAMRGRLEQGGAFACAGVSQAAQPFLAVLLRYFFPQRPIVAITEGLKTQESFQQDAETWLRLGEFKVQSSKFQVGEDTPRSTLHAPTLDTQTPVPGAQPLFYPAWEILPHELKLPHVDVISERLETLVALTVQPMPEGRGSPLIVTSVVALLQRTFPQRLLRDRMKAVSRGDRIDPLDLIEWLEDQGYEPEAEVTQKGEIALRGGIVDVYPLTSPWPVRLEFFGDELESLRYFDPLTQISREEIPSVSLPPGGELGILQRSAKTASGSPAPQTLTPCPETASINGQPPLATLLDYLPPETIFLLCEPDALAERADQYSQQIPDGDPFFISWEDLRQQIAETGMSAVEVTEVDEGCEIDGFDGGNAALLPALQSEEGIPGEPSSLHAGTASEPASQRSPPFAFCNLRIHGLELFRPIGERALDPQIAEAQRREFFAQLHRWLRQGHEVRVFCNNTGELQRFNEIWGEYGFDNEQRAASAGNAPSGSAGSGSTLRAPLSSHLGALTRGFLCDEGKLVVVTDAEIFGRYKVQRPRRLKSPHAQTSRSLLDIDFTEFEEGDYVVHLQHGIGRYLGLKILPATISRRNASATASQAAGGEECLVIEYAPGDPEQPAPKLYVPVTEAHLVSKYVGAGKARPPLHTLGGARWNKSKAQAERAVRDLAGELLAIQAARESQEGLAFAPDVPWQQEFESAFLYEETPDQMRAIVETKADMERTRPMDRLICGDVGYGKTEVAIRAAFKAVLNGKQVAILVPTTVLAQQHFNTFRERMSDYPVRIELLSRFRTRGEQSRVVRDLAAGAVDLVIGTHRLLQDDIQFKDLGLVVIDEEQRFGVLHKEKFKRLRRLVDVLTLSATPIPRTLYLALTGARDMSTIETPPQDRLPVETIVAQYDERLIRDAIQRELNRQGQVFFLHNRVATIDTMAQRLRGLVPQARIVVGHGQMGSDGLEEVMTDFVNGKADVLLSTSIIESGLDIPNANTIIIDRADRFGLSDLYQLRGRVGRYKHQAYAFLLLPRHASLLSDARKRISAIKQYSSLGSGFKIAMRDLEIRGAGNLLGPEQSGHIIAIGFELYCQLLKQSVSALKGEKVKPRIEVQVRLDFLVLNPDDGSEFRGSGSEFKVQPAHTLGVSGSKSNSTEVSSPSRMTEPTGQPASWAAACASGNVTAAHIPFSYISESRHRIEVYRKLAQTTDKSALIQLRAELRDRFGPPPPPIELLLLVAELKVLASDRGLSAIETKDGKVMLTRNGDYLTLGGKFPRLTKKAPAARLKEIKRLLLAL